DGELVEHPEVVGTRPELVDAKRPDVKGEGRPWRVVATVLRDDGVPDASKDDGTDYPCYHRRDDGPLDSDRDEFQKSFDNILNNLVHPAESLARPARRWRVSPNPKIGRESNRE